MLRLYYLLLILIAVSCGKDNKSRDGSGEADANPKKKSGSHIVVTERGVEVFDDEKEQSSSNSKKDEDDDQEKDEDDDKEKDGNTEASACQTFFLDNLAEDPIGGACAACHASGMGGFTLESGEDDANFAALEDLGFKFFTTWISEDGDATHKGFADDYNQSFADLEEACQ
ncbi:MAG: hypothetical protein AB8C84_12950 [Oligoflexales bacterium]